MVMKRVHWGWLLLLLLFVGIYSQAQAQVEKEVDKKEEIPFPDPSSLQPNWWKFFEVELPLFKERIRSVADQLSKTQAETPDFNNKNNQGLLQELTINLDVLLNLKTNGTPQNPKTPAIRENYTLDEWLEISNTLKKKKIEEKIIQGEIARSSETIDKTERSLDTLMAAYIEIKATDSGRYPKGLEIMTRWSSIAVPREKIRLAKLNLAFLQVELSNLNLEVEAASRTLLASKRDLDRLSEEIKNSTAELEESRQELAKVQTAALMHFGDTPADKALSHFKGQAVVQASIEEALKHIEFVTKNVEQHIILILIKDASDVKEFFKKLTEWEKLLLTIKENYESWTIATIRERNLIQDLFIDEPDNELGKELKRINLDRSKLSGESILSLHRLENALQKLELQMDLLEQQFPGKTGDVQTWFFISQQAFVDFITEIPNWLTQSLFKINETPVTTLGLFRVILILGLAWWFSGFVSRSLERFIESRGEQDLSGVYTLSRLIHYGILGLGLFIALSSIGLDLGNLALVAGALSLGIGFGLQSIINNFVSGLILLFERNIKRGNFIEIANGTTGVVKEINVRTTLINTNDNIDIILPNSTLVGSSVINWTLREAVRRMHIPFGVAYGSDKDLVRQAVLEAAEKVPYTFKGHNNREPQVWLIEFGDSSLNFELVVWVIPEMVKKPATVHAEYLWEIETALSKYKIEIPFPQRDIHLKSGLTNLLKRDVENP